MQEICFLDELGVMDFHYAETRVEEFLLALTTGRDIILSSTNNYMNSPSAV